MIAAAGSLMTFPSAPSAHAATVASLPITSVYQVLADSAHGHVFISRGPAAGADAPIVVTNLTGGLITTIGDGARGLALSANDATLYAAVGDTVVGYSTTTLKETTRYPLPGPGFSLALHGSNLWVSYQNSPEAEVGDIDLATGTAMWNVLPGGWVNIPPAIAIDPGGSGILVTASEGEEPPFVTTYNVYKISTVAGLQYHVYHHTATLRNLVTVVPSKVGECARLEIQQGSNSVWGRSTFTNCMDLNKYSQTVLTRKLGPTGWFRVRADFDASAKDTTNVSTDGSWVYYVVTS